ncbi:phosphotransferase enzyme family protein [Thermasporomyces composti]|uniref:Homoserine kinase type II n=1 Tax=Thermasporomyces composti TaxID=696763 RepID=A0A3D9VE29_THECX|nr:phosphotransferase [Thermasporomyces composti]REF36394.1 homoserine kinase type II [Thermasporomyces composti]
MTESIEGEQAECSTPTRELLAEVWAAYRLTGEPRLLTGSGVRDLDDPTGVERGVNLNLLAEQYGRPVVVRAYLPRVTSRRLADLQRIRGLLRDAGMPIPALIPTIDEQPWISVDGRLVEVEEYVAHDAHMDTWTRLDAGMPLLGRIHATLAGVGASTETRYPDFANAVDATDALATTARGVARIRSWGDSVRRDVQRMCDEAEELADIVAAAEAASPPTRRQLVHGDFWDNNVLFRCGNVAAVIDFDFLGHRPRVDDLALTLFFADLTLTPPEDERIPLLRRLVDRYESGLDHPLAPEERAAIPAALARQQLWAFGHITRLDEASARRLAEILVRELHRTLPIARDLERWRVAFT